VPDLPRWLEHLLHTHDTPRRTAAAYALGVLFGFSPLLGLHTVLALALAFALNLNRVAILLGVYSNLPWILVPYYTLATWFGAAVLRIHIPPGTLEALVRSLESRSWADFRSAAVTLKPLVAAFTLGSTVGAVTLSVFAYYASLVTVNAHRRHVHRLQGPEN
jgi:hypothetical protein